jgi:YidC/Oxa1 family membrane protein insertase
MFHTIFYEPIYNLIVLVLNYVPLHDVGAAIIIVTFIVKLFLLPLNLSALRTQYLMKKVEKELQEVKEKNKDNPQELAKATMDIYRREKVNPLSSIAVMIIQIPIIYALYRAFYKGLFSDPTSLYSFVHFPAHLHTFAFGLFDVTQKNIVIALLAGLSSYLLARRQTKTMVVQKKEGEETLQDQFMKSMQVQLLYVLPIIITVSAMALPSVIGLYWFTNSTITYLQDMYMRNKLKHLHAI